MFPKRHIRVTQFAARLPSFAGDSKFHGLRAEAASGDINEIFEALKPKAHNINNKFSLKVFSNKLKISGWTEFDKYSDVFTYKKKAL